MTFCSALRMFWMFGGRHLLPFISRRYVDMFTSHNDQLITIFEIWIKYAHISLWVFISGFLMWKLSRLPSINENTVRRYSRRNKNYRTPINLYSAIIVTNWRICSKDYIGLWFSDSYIVVGILQSGFQIVLFFISSHSCVNISIYDKGTYTNDYILYDWPKYIIAVLYRWQFHLLPKWVGVICILKKIYWDYFLVSLTKKLLKWWLKAVMIIVR